ncbi:putative permease YicO [Clostridium thermopalmarium DSM 5974]|uniref:Putative permease YicO n=2 Tax=Clostridium TaxID=1485 RepID=A0A2T0ASU9_9CLOT|nr:putative permease YicO [Clostridium thermopalmarium DSM 5974]PVZ25260.1 AGZA family xanthine/uracil permease-like MFS transporter [Clostridium thermopalmarium DSM 5974]
MNGNTEIVNTKEGFLEKFFKLKDSNTNVKTEMVAGLTTFLTMAYIIAVNPSFLSTTGMPKEAILTATCLSAGITTILMGIYANLPFALASGMGLNAFFAFSVCGAMKIPWQIALTAVFAEGIIFIILSVTNVRELVVNSIPITLKIAVSGGIGLFIALVGLEGAKIVVNEDSTLVTLGTFRDPRAVIAVIGIVIIGVLVYKKVKGAMLWGILACTVLSWIYALIIGPAKAAELYEIYLPSEIFAFHGIGPIAGKLDFSVFTYGEGIFTFISVLLTFLFVDFFDTVGTLVGVASKVNMIDKSGKVLRANRALLVDAIGTTMGALMGVSTVTTYVESSAGVAEGGRTGLTAVTTGILFILSMFLAPIFIAIPSCATAPALVIVGLFMMQNITQIDFYDYAEAIPAFLTIILMPLTYSIATGLMFGVIAYVIFNLFAKKANNISPTIYILALIFIIKLAVT